MVKCLLDAGAEVNLKDKESETALNYSFAKKDISLTELILANGANPDIRNKDNVTSLMVAAKKNRKDIVELFLRNKKAAECKLMLSQKSNDGSTAVHLAACEGNLEVFIYLLQKGGNMKLPNNNNETPLDILGKFYISNNEDTFKLFVKTIGNNFELLEMLPSILPRFSSPNAILNSCFGDLLLNLKKAPDLDIVSSLVYLSVGIQLAAIHHPLEAVDLVDRLNTTNNMLIQCMGSDALDDEDNVTLIFQDTDMRKSTNQCKKFLKAKGFLQGPFYLCIKHSILPILGTRQVNFHNTKFY